MGNLLSCQFTFACDKALHRIYGCLCAEGYIPNLKKNFIALQKEMEDLRTNKDEVLNKVKEEWTGHKQRRKAVTVWFERVEEIDIEFNERVEEIKLQKLYLCGLCSKNLCSSNNYGESVFLLLEKVKKLKSEGNFETVVELTPSYEVPERPTQLVVGLEKRLQEAWIRLMEDGVGFMGLHGMGGIGKTTLFKEIHNRFAEKAGSFAKIARSFDVVIWVVVSQGAKISKLQEDIAQNLKLCDEEWKDKNESDKAVEIHRVLKGKRFVLMLDDIWEEVDLEGIGVPFPTRDNKCKVTFTTRSLEVCGRMGDHEPMQVHWLEQDKAWEFFRNNVGDNTLNRHPRIVELARKVAEKCGGLPLALKVIGKTMASKTTVEEWEHAIDVLTRSAAEFPDMKHTILPVLKFSYDNLVDENVKSCFLYCALFPEDYQIDKEALIDYWICEGFIGEYQVIRRAINKGYEILCTLVHANLLNGTECVVMHGVVREMALWIASDFGKQEETFIVKARVGLRKMSELRVRDMGAVKRMSLMDNNIEEMACASKCSELTTLFLQNNKGLKNISDDFILSMQKLLVLDLSDTSIEQLSVGFQEWRKLTHLNLTDTKRLCSLSGISKLSSLRILKLQNSKVHGDASLVEELLLLKHLEVLTITISTELGLEQILGDPRLANCTKALSIIDFQLKPIDISLLARMENLCVLSVENSHCLHYSKRPCYTRLSRVTIRDCDNIKDLTWLLFAPNLVSIEIENLEELEEIVNEEKATKLTGTTPFQNLQSLVLVYLPNLESIYWCPLPFQVLNRIVAESCPKLRKLPLNATSVAQVEKFHIGFFPDEEETELEWEDDKTKDRFLPRVKRLH